MNKDYFREPVKVVRLWVHECERVLADRMINDTDMTKFNEFRVTVTKKYFDEVNQVNKIATLLRCRDAAMTVAMFTCMSCLSANITLQSGLNTLILTALAKGNIPGFLV